MTLVERLRELYLRDMCICGEQDRRDSGAEKEPWPHSSSCPVSVRDAAAARIEELEQAHTVDNGFDITEGLHEAREAVLAGRARIAALQEALRDVLDCVWSGSLADRKFWRDEAVATFERAAALAQDDTATGPRE